MRRKVFFMIPSLAGGGAERVFVNLVNGIDKSVFDVTLIYLSDERNVYNVTDNINVINLNKKRLRNSLFKIIKLIRNEKPELIVSTHGHMNIILLILKYFFPIKTKIIVRQTNIISKNTSSNPLIKSLKSRITKYYNKADKIICQSELMKDDFVEFTGVDISKVIKIYNPIDINSILLDTSENVKNKINSQYNNIFFVGRLTEVKGIPKIIDAFYEYYKQNSKTNLYIIGKGPKENKLKEYVEQKRLSKNVIFLGFQMNPYKWIKHADLFIMASKHEGMPNTLIEALALEVPVLILKHPGGTIDILKSLNLENRFVDKLIINEDSFKQYDDKVLPKLIEHFGIESVVKKYENVFLSAIKGE
ncbi:glycosyltransferase [Virgibacillus salexigens]|uniref:glycosyltransferase n=1 Tax=Virgibacillus TaxID=84406 RepID=UPI00137206B9|nr:MULTISPECIES: glycosyltransferase [Virgibacillus]MYL40670.1 glycosyltransferase [Virgibacillus massiliensis]